MLNHHVIHIIFNINHDILIIYICSTISLIHDHLRLIIFLYIIYITFLGLLYIVSFYSLLFLYKKHAMYIYIILYMYVFDLLIMSFSHRLVIVAHLYCIGFPLVTLLRLCSFMLLDSNTLPIIDETRGYHQIT